MYETNQNNTYYAYEQRYVGPCYSPIGINVERPSAPVNALISNLEATSAVLSWSAGVDGIGVTGHWVYDINTGRNFHLFGNATSILIEELAPETNYFYIVFTQGTNGTISLHSLNFNFRTPAYPTIPFP